MKRTLLIALKVLCGGPSALAIRTYTVEQRDTLTRITQRPGVNLDAVVDLNPQRNPHALRLGQG